MIGFGLALSKCIIFFDTDSGTRSIWAHIICYTNDDSRDDGSTFRSNRFSPENELSFLLKKELLSVSPVLGKNEKNSAIVNRYELYHYTPIKVRFFKGRLTKLGNFQKVFLQTVFKFPKLNFFQILRALCSFSISKLPFIAVK